MTAYLSSVERRCIPSSVRRNTQKGEKTNWSEPEENMESNKVIDALIGVAVGDAVGVPYEFSSRDKMKSNPATGMIGYGTYNQPEGTWSDDSSLTFCLAESLVTGYNLKEISENFIKWKMEAYWSARGKVFDIGSTTSKAISRLSQIINDNNLEELKQQKFYGDESDNGNGSLMRIIPLLFYIKGKSIKEQFEKVWEISALTHRHIRAAMSCLIYLKFAEKLLAGKDKEIAYSEMRTEIQNFWDEMDFSINEREHFAKIIKNDIRQTKIEDLKSGGYVIEVLESSIWFFLNNDSYEETILSIINIGHDTDTSAAITGGLAGIYYGLKGIPEYWVISIARMEDIFALANRLNNKYCA
ncbi:ADP-ribosylglycohydrolase family protein [Saprospiraceae bacterium]|nr:ADP-ribosylglycohydrolase family protein [Saprospiraceae bacterium]